MKACLLLFASLALISQGQKMEPVTCDYSKGEMMCSGEWTPDWKEQISPDYCIPDKVGDCANFCPMKCGEGDMVCPGKMGPDGCKMADFCNNGKFCPVDCDWSKEMMCGGEWVKGEQISADYCIPNKNGDCPASCPVKCSENDMVCPGKMGYSGCQDPDYCYSGKFCPVDCDWSKEMMCGGEWDPKTGDQMTPDFCIANKVGDCANFCPVKCGENDMLCPGKEGPDGCKMSDFCHYGSKFCPVDCPEKMCIGEWSPDWKEQISPDYCIPYKNGDCENFCPMKCAEGDMVCPGKMDSNGCKMADFCHHGKFCPVDCDWEKEMMCSGEWEKGEQITADYCIPSKVGDCPGQCPVKCGENDNVCPGKEDTNGCKMPDICWGVGKECPNFAV